MRFIDNPDGLGDFTTTPRVIPLSVLAIGIGIASGFIALILLRLIGLVTNLCFYHRVSTAMVSPANNHLGWLEILVPVGGGLIVGFMARYGSERIRGHGIPEAIEAILIKGSRVAPRLAILKPLSSAISIGTGGPFGAEGPIIMTGGAFGSMIAQFLHTTSAERKTLLVAGAAGGMAATFGAPVAAVLLAVELLLFEWKPRSLVPVALSSAAATVVRACFVGWKPLFPVPAHLPVESAASLLGCVLAGVIAGVAATVLTRAVYAAEDAFGRLPIHWMWWPAIGGVVVGVGGLIFPQALGVGYDTIGVLLRCAVSPKMIVGVLLVKSAIWAISLGSGTSGGVLAPLLMIGGALGGLEAMFLPNQGLGFWPLISTAAILGGTMRAPLTGVLFAVELTHDVGAMLPLLIAATVAHCCTVLTLRRSILTEKVARRGYHLSREYEVDPLETLAVQDVMRTNIPVLPLNRATGEATGAVAQQSGVSSRPQSSVVTADGHLISVVKAGEPGSDGESATAHRPIAELLDPDPVVAYPNERLRAIAFRMAETGATRLPVVSRTQPRSLLGMVSLNDLIKARMVTLDAERRRERVLSLRLVRPRRRAKRMSERTSNGQRPRA